NQIVRLAVERVVRVLGVKLGDVFRVFANLVRPRISQRGGCSQRSGESEGNFHCCVEPEAITRSSRRAATLCERMRDGGPPRARGDESTSWFVARASWFAMLRTPRK